MAKRPATQLIAQPSTSLRLGARAVPLVDALLENADALRLGVTSCPSGATVIDAGVDAPGSLEAGRQIAEICTAGLASVRIAHSATFARWPWQVEVTTSSPVLACLGSQYAGWSLSVTDGTAKPFHALGSGPARALARVEALFEELNYADAGDTACLVLETSDRPPPALAQQVAAACSISPADLQLILTPTGSPAGVVQIAARVVEVAMHKAHELKFPLDAVVEGLGTTPLPPPTRNGLTAMGRTNDTILFGGSVHLVVDATDADAQDLAQRLPSSTSRDYGKPFAETFADYGHDFFKVDPMLFSPAQVAVTTLDSGRTFRGGRLDEALLERSFGTE